MRNLFLILIIMPFCIVDSGCNKKDHDDVEHVKKRRTQVAQSFKTLQCIQKGEIKQAELILSKHGDSCLRKRIHYDLQKGDYDSAINFLNLYIDFWLIEQNCNVRTTPFVSSEDDPETIELVKCIAENRKLYSVGYYTEEYRDVSVHVSNILNRALLFVKGNKEAVAPILLKK